MAATKTNPIVLYDIHSKKGTWSPNTYKTRLTLHYKRLPYRVEWVSLADVESKLKELGVPPSDNNPLFKYTLPLIADPSRDPTQKPTYVTDSFDIAVYLDDKYPAPTYPLVFPRGTRALQYVAVDRITQVGMLLAPVMLPLLSLRTDLLDDRSREYFNRTRSAIFGCELPKLLDKADENWEVAKARWDNINEVFKYNQGGPFVMGHQISFVDFLIGGIILMMRKSEGGEMTYWNKMAGWHDGRWKALWEEIEKLEADSSETA